MPWRIWVLWGLFVARGCFYCVTMPLWEGWDEYAHFAYLQHAVSSLTLARLDEPISREIDASMRVAPLADELRWIGPPYLTHPQWWALPVLEREARVHALAAIPPAWAFQKAEHAFTFYEAQQPPLYYWMMSLPLRLLGSWHLWPRVLAIRILSMMLASLAIPLTFFSARIVLNGSGALWAAALLAMAPGFAIDTSRVSNDALAIPLAALLCLLTMRRASWIAIGVTAGLGLLTKAYFMGFALGLVLLGLWRPAVLAVLIGASWYVRNVMIGYSLSGWLDQAPLSKTVAAVFVVNWIDAARVTAKSFFWFGGWSFITLKSWIYTVVNLFGLAGAVFSRNVRIPWIFTICIFAEITFGILNYQVMHGMGSLPGWYAWVAGGMMAMILASGLGAAAWFLILGLGAVDVYGASLMARHYHSGPVWLGLIPLAAAIVVVTARPEVWPRRFRRETSRTSNTAI